MRRRILLNSMGLAALGLARTTWAEAYPAKAVRLVVTAPPGGTADYLARTLTERMTRDLHQTVLVDNRAGASGMLGADAVAKAAPDGYTALLTEGASLAINAGVRKDLPFNAQQDLQPVSLLATTPSILVANPAFPASNLRELIALAKQSPNSVAYASPGTGTPHHLAGALLAQMAGVRLTHVPYKGGGPMITDVVGGQVPTLFTGVLGVLPFLKQGKLKAIAIGSKTRMASLPDVPTFAESGFPGFEAEVFFGAFLPARAPADAVRTLSSAFAQALHDPEVRRKLEEQALNVVGSTPDQLRARFRQDMDKWSALIRATGVTLE